MKRNCARAVSSRRRARVIIAGDPRVCGVMTVGSAHEPIAFGPIAGASSASPAADFGTKAERPGCSHSLDLILQYTPNGDLFVTQPRFASMVLAACLIVSACSRGGSSEATTPEPAKRIAIAVTADGFVPAQSRVKVGQPVTLVVTRQVAKTCATDIVIKDYAVNRPLPENQPVEITFTPTKAGPIRYACAMDMVSGELVAE